MSEGYHGEFMIINDVQEVGRIVTGRGAIGASHALRSPEEAAEFQSQLSSHTERLTAVNTADCGDERLTIGLANGVTDKTELRARIVPQLFGGLVLPVTKSLVAANAAVIRDAKNMRDAYLTVDELLSQLDYEDGGHAGCGASGTVESSVAHDLPDDRYESSLSLLSGGLRHDTDLPLLAALRTTQQHRLSQGFYGVWDPAWHEDYLSHKYPHNFSYLAVDENDHETHGHHASGLYVVTQEEMGFAKNAMIEDTGREAFAVTVPFMKKLAHQLGGNIQERRAIELALYDDTIRVGSGLVVPTLPIFA